MRFARRFKKEEDCQKELRATCLSIPRHVGCAVIVYLPLSQSLFDGGSQSAAIIEYYLSFLRHATAKTIPNNEQTPWVCHEPFTHFTSPRRRAPSLL